MKTRSMLGVRCLLDRLRIGNMGVEFGTEASSINSWFGISFVLGGLTHENGWSRPGGHTGWEENRK